MTGTLVRTLLVFTLIPLAVMAGAAYFRSRTLLREQAAAQSANLLINQLKIIDREIKVKETKLEEKIKVGDFSVLIELALHANPQSEDFKEIRNLFLAGTQGGDPIFDEILLVDSDGTIKVASRAEWQSEKLDPEFLESDENHSVALYGLSPLIQDELILITAVNYKTERGSFLGTVIGITEKQGVQQLVQPLNGLAPYANSFFILSNGALIASDPASGEFNFINTTTASQEELIARLADMMNGGDQTPVTLDVIAPNGEPALAQLVWFPSLHSGVVLEISSNNIYSQINSLLPFTAILALITIAAIAIAIGFGTRRVIEPLRSLALITQNFAAGDWGKRAEVTRNDEVGLLADSFNHMADQLGELYQSLEKKVDERSLQIRTAAEVAQSITTIPDLDEMLNKTSELLVQQFGYYQASIFLMDRGGRNIEFKSGFGPATKDLTDRKYKLEVGSASIVGWVAAKNEVRVASDVLVDPLHLANELLPETRSEASVPIALGSHVLGVLDTQSAHPDAFGTDTLVMLRTLANQIAAAIQTAGLIESSQVNFQELERLYRSSRLIAEARSEVEILEAGGRILQSIPYPIILFKAGTDSLQVVSSADSTRSISKIISLPETIRVGMKGISDYLRHGPLRATRIDPTLPKPFKEIMDSLELTNAAFLPIENHNVLGALVMIGSRNDSLSNSEIQPYANLVDLMSVALERSDAIQQTEKHLREVEALASINDLIASTSDIQAFYHALLEKIQQIIGDYSLTVALYDSTNNSVSIPFNYESGMVTSVESFPVGEGLTSILLRTRQPLMLVEDTERKAAALGAKISGKPARSWMGAPMLIQNNPIGALIIQDAANEHAFDEGDLKFFTTIAGQVAGVINNIHLLDESQQRALQLETTSEIARDISGSLNLDELLIKAVSLIRERFNFYHAAIFLLDLPGEFAVIREATGEAGAQMKRAGYKIGVGSKSIVGFVSGRGELLVVNDTSKDATYYANPLLPDTRSEAAIPLHVGERILGVLDVQSTVPFAFSDDDLRSLQILADQLAVAVANTELFAETQEHLSQHRLLHHITSTVASGTTLDEALENAVNGLQVTLGGDRVIILLADRARNMLQIKASVGYSENVTNAEVEIGKGIAGWVAAHRRPLRVRDVNEDPRYIQISANTRSELAVPLVYRNELLGVLNVESEQADAYTENDEEMLGTLGGSLAAIIANARLLEQLRTQSERERLVFDVTSKIRKSPDIQSILMTTASEITRITGARYMKILLNPAPNPEEKDTP